ncbi:MAG: pyridoxal 5'-phosphate synthase lyase subunit PdxS [Candidatus Thermoplasmatota archaeon]|nr:pyridoxal 5'-phosphate synthase lyase subunit PdxS [Candidatus Thermoplasmatota archaeon]
MANKRVFEAINKHGVIMDVTGAEQAGIAEGAGAIAVMALEMVPSDIRASGGVARMASVKKIEEIMDAVSIPVMAKCRIGHTAEARILEALGVDMIDESEVLTSADPFFHIDKKMFEVPFVCGCRNIGEAVRRIYEGAVMIRTKGEAGTGNIIEAVRHQRMMLSAFSKIANMDEESLGEFAQEIAGAYNIDDGTGIEEVEEGAVAGAVKILKEIGAKGKLPVPNYAAGGIATPADAALMMLLGSDGVFVGSGIFKSENPESTAKAIVEVVAHFNDPKTLKEAQRMSGKAMRGIEIEKLEEKLQMR